MEKLFFIGLLLFHYPSFLLSQYGYNSFKPTNDSLISKLRGVQIIDLGYSKAQEEALIHNATSPDAQVLSGLVDYLRDDLGLQVIVTEEQREQSIKIAKSQCDYGYVSLDIGAFNSELFAVGNYPVSLTFGFCDATHYTLKTTVPVNGLTNYRRRFYNEFKRMLYFQRRYDPSLKISVPKNKIVLNESDFIKYLQDSIPKSKYEGIFELFSSDNNTAKYRLGILNQNDTLKIIYFSGATFSDDWSEGELKGVVMKTKSENDFMGTIFGGSKNLSNVSLSFLNENSFEVRSATLKGVDKYVRVR